MTAMMAPHPAQTIYGLGTGTAPAQVPFGTTVHPQISQIQPQAGQVVPPAAILHASQLAAAAMLDLIPYVIQARLAQVLPQMQFGQSWGQQPWFWSQPQYGQQFSTQPVPWAAQVQPQFGGLAGSFL